MSLKKIVSLASGMVALCLLAVSPARASINIIISPQSQTVLVTSNATFTASVNATAGETITGYSWLTSTNGSAPFNTVPGATNTTLLLTNAQVTNSGSYFIKVAYTSGTNATTTVSTAVTLTVLDPPRVLVPPQSLISGTGSNVTFSVTAAGGMPLSYQWQLNGVNLTNGNGFGGVTSTTLSITSLTTNDGGNYTVVVTNVYGSVTSSMALLTVLVPPYVITPPANFTVIMGNTATFSVTAGGSLPLSYQWLKNGAVITNGAKFSGVTTANLTIANAQTNDAGNYSVKITNALSSITSTSGLLTVLVPPTITSATNATSQQGFPFSYQATATGSTPITFSTSTLPAGLSITPGGLISGIPSVFGVFNITLFAANAAATNSTNLNLTLITDVPGITSALAITGNQGSPLNYSIIASNNPTIFSASGLPLGLTINTNTGTISGTPLVNGTNLVTIGAANIYGADSKTLIITLITDVPGITSALSVTNAQGTNFNYAITASNGPTSFSAGTMPSGLSFNAASGVISGPPLIIGVYAIPIGVSNQFGSDSKVLTLTVSSSVPVITSGTNANGTQGNTNFSYTIKGSHSPTLFGSSTLPLGLALNPTNGIISGTPEYGGTNTITIWAANAYGTGYKTLQLSIAYSNITQLAITSVTTNYSAPYVLDFTFTLRDDTNAVNDPSAGNPVVRKASELQVVCMESGVPIPNETTYTVDGGLTGRQKSLNTFLVLDYTYSMFIDPGAIDYMQQAASNLITEEPINARFGVFEFNADYEDPQLVTNFTSDKIGLINAINGIQANYVQGNYAGTRVFDAIYNALTNFNNLTNPTQENILVALTDGNDDSSLLNTNADPIATIVDLALTNNVLLYCVAIGTNVNVTNLTALAAGTGGRYLIAGTAADLPTQFATLLQDYHAQYSLQWATLQRAAKPFQPMFSVTVDGITAYWNTNMDTNNAPSNAPPYYPSLVELFNPPDWATNSYVSNVLNGVLHLIPDSQTNATMITLRADYVPRYIRQLRYHYRPNYSCVPVLANTNAGQLLNGWTMVQTNDGTGGFWLTLASPNTTNLLTSLPYGTMGDLVNFQFEFLDLPNNQSAFSQFDVDNTIYTNTPPVGQFFVITNSSLFITNLPPTPPLGTPIPWLIANGFTGTNYAAIELSKATNGMLVWQDYIAGLNPNDPNSVFKIDAISAPKSGQPPQITFNTALGRTYQVQTATTLGNWIVLQDGIAGTGAPVTIYDYRNLTGVSPVFYQVVVDIIY